ELAPMYNRALEGTFQPGSTFKIGVAMGALDSGVIDENTQIKDEGVYEIDGFQFRCWIYLMYKETHGWVNVTDAIQVSCNYFFYEVGRRLTIEKIDDYMTSFGLGQPTGIELNEKTGILASPEYVEENGLRSWAIGDTLQASIGQSYNLFTPLQMSVYISSVVNNGTRYSAHILSKVCPYSSTDPIYEPGTTVAAERKIKDGVREIVMNAMKNVIEDGSVSEIFEDYPIVIGGKTGTAQVSVTRSDNAIFTAFAPFDDPEIVVASVLEQGNTGSNAGRCVRDVFDYYFNIDENAPKEPDDGGDE
ncbi:MAG: penicillin-binding protein 2, partial [Clostridia bacterium]|nr:penicillin-binding protein 2 [Clostridia bacterium]